MPYLRLTTGAVRAYSSCSIHGRLLRIPCLKARKYSVVASSRSEQVAVKCRSNGSITLDIHHPLIGSQASTIVLYLSAGPIVKKSTPDAEEQVISALSASSNATIVRINYRLSSADRYPLPIHDVLAGYDWVIQHLAPSSTWTSRNGRRSNTVARLGVCGELIGGSLATMLALTECRMGESRIAAAAVNNPVVDWVFPQSALEKPSTQEDVMNWMDELPLDEWVDASLFAGLEKPRKKTKKKDTPSSWTQHAHNPVLSASTLRYARNELFHKPVNYFDPFASPTLFFRTPGADVPPDDPLDDFASLVEDGDAVKNESTVRRKSHRVFPLTGSALRLPDLRVTVGEESVLHDQGVELVKLARRSVLRDLESGRNMREGTERFSTDLDGIDDEALREERHNEAVAESERRVSLSVNTGVGLWGLPGEHGWRRQVEEIGSWFRRVLG